VRELAHQHLIELDEKICQLQSIRGELRYLLSRRMVARSDEVCPLLSALLGKVENAPAASAANPNLIIVFVVW
jgi:hypothetical protein